MSPDARDFLDFIVKQYEPHRKEIVKMTVENPALKKYHPDDNGDNSYSAFYWLIRYSGLVEPSKEAKAILSGKPLKCYIYRAEQKPNGRKYKFPSMLPIS